MTAYGRAAAANLADEVISAGDHDTLVRACARIGDLVAAGELDRVAAEGQLAAWGARIGRPSGEVRRAIRWGFARPATPAGPGRRVARDRADVVEACVAAWDDAQQHLVGRTGATRLKIIAGLLLRSVAVGQLGFAASMREVAEAAGVACGTVTKHRRGLTRWVACPRPGNRALGTRSEWQVIRRSPGTLDPRAPGNRVVVLHGADALFPGARTVSDPAANCWHRWPCGWRVYGLLDRQEGRTASVMAAEVGLHVGTVRRILRRLAAEGLVRRASAGAWVASGCVEAPHGIVDHAADRRRRHENDRVLHVQTFAASARRWRARVRDRPRLAVDRLWLAGLAVAQ